jgi:hypothetical protein
MLHARCNPEVSGQLYHAREFLRAAFGERGLGQLGLIARCKAMVLTTAAVSMDEDGGGKALTAPWKGPRVGCFASPRGR